MFCDLSRKLGQKIKKDIGDDYCIQYIAEWIVQTGFTGV